VHASIDARESPAAVTRSAVARAGRPLVTVDCLRDVPDGGTFPIAPDAHVTPLARDVAFARGITLQPTNRGRAVGVHLRVALGCDHGGFALKADVLASLRELGVQVLDLGTRDANACDYPNFARAVAEAVAEGRADLGVCIDGAGIGSAMTANKVPGVLAANCWDVASASNAREHNHARVLTLGAGHLQRAAADAILRAFLATPPGAGRHARRVGLILATEAHYSRSKAPREP
jgi:ribose 5-phosphate isomerase B